MQFDVYTLRYRIFHFAIELFRGRTYLKIAYTRRATREDTLDFFSTKMNFHLHIKKEFSWWDESEVHPRRLCKTQILYFMMSLSWTVCFFLCCSCHRRNDPKCNKSEWTLYTISVRLLFNKYIMYMRCYSPQQKFKKLNKLHENEAVNRPLWWRKICLFFVLEFKSTEQFHRRRFFFTHIFLSLVKPQRRVRERGENPWKNSKIWQGNEPKISHNFSLQVDSEFHFLTVAKNQRAKLRFYASFHVNTWTRTIWLFFMTSGKKLHFLPHRAFEGKSLCCWLAILAKTKW